MIKSELMKWYDSLDSEGMPKYVEISDVNNGQVCIDKTWRNVVFVWSVFSDGRIWKYVETDSERGYVVDIKAFDEESDAVEYAKEILNRRYLATKGNSKEEMLCRYIQQEYGYSEKRSRTMVNQMLPYNDIFEEFFNYACVGKFFKKDKSQTEICGYTAEVLNKDFNLSPLGAYNFLVYLKEEPKRAIADLKAGLLRR